MISRRQFINLAVIAASLPLVSRLANAAAVKIATDDPAAVALKYVEIASDAIRPDKMGVPGSKQVCGNCRFYTESETPDWGGCTLFQSKLVAKQGWCVGWVPLT